MERVVKRFGMKTDLGWGNGWPGRFPLMEFMTKRMLIMGFDDNIPLR